MNKIIYLDAAASSLKPQAVIDAEVNFLTHDYSNSGRGICARAVATDAMVAGARQAVADFIGAASDAQVVFTSGTTGGMNQIARMVRGKFRGRVRVVVSDLDHHSARMPFVHGADVGLFPLDKNYDYDLSRVPVADVMVITAMSNVLGRPQDVTAIVRAARAKNPDVITVVDAAQYVAHGAIDVGDWDCDFLCFSGHKIGADTGVGVMYIKNPDDFLPDNFGGGMVSRIAEDGQWKLEPAPAKFEAGTLPLTQIAGLPAAINAWRAWSGGESLINALYDAVVDNKNVRILTTRDAALFSFVVPGIHPLDVGAMIGAHNICVRAGNMCASWIHRAMGLDGSVRVSVGPWNTMDDVRRAADVIQRIAK